MQASSRERRRGLCVVRREGLPMPRRRTLTSGILPSVRSMLTSLRHPWLRSSATPAPGTRATPRSVHASRSTGFQPVTVSRDVSHTACAAAVQAQRREANHHKVRCRAWFARGLRPAGFHVPCTRARGSSVRRVWFSPARCGGSARASSHFSGAPRPASPRRSTPPGCRRRRASVPAARSRPRRRRLRASSRPVRRALW